MNGSLVDTGLAIDGHRVRDTVQWPVWAAGCALLLVLLFSTHSFQFLFVTDIAGGLAERPSARSSPGYAALFLLQLGLFSCVLLTHIMSNGISRPLLVAAGYCLFVAGSVFWSVSPGTTMMPAVLFSYLVVAAYVTSVIFPPRVFLKIYFRLCAFLLAASFLLLMSGSPFAGTNRYGGGWLLDLELSGVMASKNFAGIVFASAVILAINGRQFGASLLARIFVFFGGLAAVVLSNSATAVLIVVLLAVPAILLRISRTSWQPIAFMIICGLALLIPLLPFVSGVELLSLLGRDATFTGRAFLWEAAFEAFQKHPFLGHGYYAFFDTDPHSPVWRMWERFRYWNADNFHNSSVDILVSLGLVGVAVMFATIFKAASVVANDSVDRGSRINLALLVAVFTVGSMMEFAMFHHNYVATFILFYALFASMWDYPEADECA